VGHSKPSHHARRPGLLLTGAAAAIAAGTFVHAAISTASTEPVSTGSAADPDGCTDERVGGDLTFGAGSPIRGLDPIVALGTGSSGGTELTAIYDTLMRWDPASGDYLPHVAESVSGNDDRTEWTVVLRDGVTFGNGDPLTADAVAFSIERMSTASVAAAGLAAEIESTEVVDDLTIILRTASAHGQIPYLLSTEVGMVVNPAVVEAMSPEEFANLPTGAGVGPFEVESFIPNDELVLHAKDDYWGGPVCLETVRVLHNPDGRIMLDSLRSGEYQMIFLSDAQVIADARDNGVELYSDIGGGAGVFLLNHREGAMTSDPRVRQAFALALDPELINERVNEGTAIPATGIAAPEQAIYPGIDGPAYDPEAATALVEEAKADGWDGSLNLVCNNSPTNVEQALITEGMLEAVGFDVTVENLPYNDWARRWSVDFTYDAACYGLIVFDSGPLARLNQFASDSPRNRTGIADEAMDAALEALQAAATQEETVAAMADIQAAWNEQLPMAAVWASDWFIGAADELHGVIPTRDVVVMLHDAWLGD
jgi:peptide/nickel transport system substrate-binding protein